MFPGLSGLRVTCDHVATETQISRIQCPHLLLRTYILFPAKSLSWFSLSFQGRISCVCSRVLPTCSTLPSFCCWCCSLHRLMNSVPWAKPPLWLQTQIPSLQTGCIPLSLPGTGAVRCGPHRTGTKAFSLLSLWPGGGELATRIESTAKGLAVTMTPFRSIPMCCYGTECKCYKSWWCRCDHNSVT